MPGYNLGNSCARRRRPSRIKDWSLSIPKAKLIKIGAKVSEPTEGMRLNAKENGQIRLLDC
jgi:hypothetical protein